MYAVAFFLSPTKKRYVGHKIADAMTLDAIQALLPIRKRKKKNKRSWKGYDLVFFSLVHLFHSKNQQYMYELNIRQLSK